MKMKSHLAFPGFVSLVLLFTFSPAQSQVSFFQPPTYSGNFSSQFVVDFNGDGKPDILSGDGTMNLGKGDGTFTRGTAVTGGALAVADFNGDGKPDVLQQGTGTLNGTLLVLLGAGDGTFQAPISSLSYASLSLVSTADLNGDGNADVIGIFNNALIVYLSKGDGTFASGVSYNLGISSGGPGALSLGDFNGDGKIDVGVNVGEGTGIGLELVFLGNGDGTLQIVKTSASVDNPKYVVQGDFNSDGKLDLAVSTNPQLCGTSLGPCTVSILLGDGDGTFQAPVSVITPSGTLAVADLNGDGKLDLIVQGDTTLAQVYLGDGHGAFSNIISYVLYIPPDPLFYPPPSAIAVADFNLDGKPDVAILGSLLLGNGDGTLQGVPWSAVPFGASVTGVFDKNSTLPEVATEQGDKVFILKVNPDGSLSKSHIYTMQMSGYQIFAEDLDMDGNLDVLVLNSDSTTNQAGYSVLLGNGDGSFQAPTFYPLAVTGSAAFADLNRDGTPDLIISEGYQVNVLLGKGNGIFSPPVSYFTAGSGFPFIGDFNGDGNPDIAEGVGAYPGETEILYGVGDGTFQPAVFPPSLSGFGLSDPRLIPASFSADLNGDGRADLVGNQVALGNSDGTFTLLSLPFLNDTYTSGNVNAIADFNGDGRPDLIGTTTFQSHVKNTGILLGNGDGSFSPQLPVPFGYLPQNLWVADMNNDGRPDIVFFWNTPAGGGTGVMLNTTRPGFELSNGALLPAPVTAGSSATSTLTVAPTFGFKNSVMLSVSGLPSGASYAFNPSMITNSSGTSVLTISTSTGTTPGTYTLQVQGTGGSVVNTAAVSLVIQAPQGFALSAASGSPTSQTVSAGQTANFSLAVTPAGSFTGTVNFGCAITPVVTPAPTCSVPGSVQISGGGGQVVTVKVSTTAPGTALATAQIKFTPTTPLWIMLVLGSGLFSSLISRRRLTLAVPIVTMALVVCVACGSSSSSSHKAPGTPAGTYAATVTASSGSAHSNMTLQVTIQ